MGGLHEVVQHQQTGIVVHPDDPESLARGILETLNHPVLAAERASRAYQTVREQYNWDRIAGMTIQVYQRIIDERGKVDW